MAVDVEALVAGDDVAIWTLLHRLRLASSRHGPLPGDTAGLPGGSEHGKGSVRGRHCRQVLPYSEEQMAAQPSSVGMLDAVAAGTLQPELPQGHFWHKLVRDCCQYAPSKRPSAADLAIRLQTSAMAELARQADSRAEHKLD